MNKYIQTLKRFKIGLTVFAGIVIFLVLMLIVGSESNTFTSTETIKLFLSDVNGLADGSMVTLGGLKIGSIEKMEFGRRGGIPGVIVSTKLASRYAVQITSGSKASIKTVGMLGDKYIDFSIGLPSEQPLADGSFIPVKKTKELGDVLDQMGGIMDDIGATAKNVHALTDTVRHGHGAAGKLLADDRFGDEIASIGQKLNNIASALSERKGSLGKLIYDDGLYAKINHTAGILSTLSDSIAAGKGTAGKILANDSLYYSLQSVSKRIDMLLLKINSDSSSIGPLVNSDTTYRQLNGLITNLNSMISDIKENPKKYIHLSIF
jgi:phospholipid/cholesterol/gamma-HCH transport system substrate-binding protein